MQYATMHTANDRLGVIAVIVLLLAFALAFTLMWLHPTLAILVFFLGMLFAIGAGIAWGVSARAERRIARASLRSHECPRCGKTVHREAGLASDWHCDECDATFADSGFERSA